MNKRIIALILMTSVALAGCSAANGGNTGVSSTGDSVRDTSVVSSGDAQVTETTETAESSETSDTSDTSETESQTSATETEKEKFEFNPHVHVGIMDQWIDQDTWESFYNLCDALREGRDTFECSSKEAYEWCIADTTLGALFPAASMKVCGKSDDGSKPFEDGVGRIYYKVPKEECVKAEKEFEVYIEDIINTYVEKDDTDFEKCLKLYDYIESNYYYGDLDVSKYDGFFYVCLMEKKGVCADISAAYAYLLMQVGVDALSVGSFDDLDHAWTYLVIDGQGYHSDPTWALKSYTYMERLDLDYFLMTDEERVESGCAVDDLTVGLYPKFWIKDTAIDITATSERFKPLGGAIFDRLDEENKIIYYWEADEPKEFCYR